MKTFVRPRLAVSHCLLGAAVRFDGGHKRDASLVERLGPHVEWRPLCPELESGLGVPREALQLELRAGRLCARGVSSGRDHTAALARLSRARLREFRAAGITGAVLKQRSPSCGVHSAVLAVGGGPRKTASGIFAGTLLAHWPELPLLEEGADAAARRHFLERVFAAARFQAFCAAGPDRDALLAFHDRRRLQLQVHAPGAWRRLGALAAGAARRPGAARLRAYAEGYGGALARPPSRSRTRRALRSLETLLAPQLQAAPRRELARALDAFDAARDLVCAPGALLDLLRGQAERVGAAVARQSLLGPFPAALRSFVGDARAGCA